MATTAMSLADAIQTRMGLSPASLNPGAVLAALTAALIAATEAAGLPLGDTLAATANIVNHGDGRRPEFRAASAYFGHEIFKIA